MPANIKKNSCDKIQVSPHSSPTKGENMLIEKHIAVVYNVTGAPAFCGDKPEWKLGEHRAIVTMSDFIALQANSRMGFLVIREAWTMGECISN